MADKAVVEIVWDEKEGCDMLVKYTGDDPLGESQAMMQANVMVALFHTELKKHGAEAVLKYVEDNHELWAGDTETRAPDGGPKGEKIW